MVLAIGVALVGGLWQVPFHPDAAGLILGLDAAVAGTALLCLLALRTVARRRPELVVFVMLIAVVAASIVLGIGHHELALAAIGYLLLLPVVVSLFIPWETKIHVTWLACHAALALGYTLFSPASSIPEGARDQLLGLIIVAIAISQAGHLAGLQAWVSDFSQIQQISALNRRARRDQARLDSLNEALEATAATDALTGLGNRLALDAGLRAARSRIDRHGERYGLLMLDLDRFKAINDERGHLAGDDVLRATSDALQGALRVGDAAYRYGGEEFVALTRLTASGEALETAERLRRAVEDLRIPSTRNTPYGHLTTSVGVATIGRDDLGSDDATWLARADAALYRAKVNGRNRSESEPLGAPSSAGPSSGLGVSTAAAPASPPGAHLRVSPPAQAPASDGVPVIGPSLPSGPAMR